MMTSHEISIFNPRLFDDDDDAEDLVYKEIINYLITQQTTSAQAAEAIEKWVIREANAKYEELRQRDPPFNLTPEEENMLNLVGPNSARHVDMMVRTVAKICSAYPPGHTVQNLLIEFFHALKALPRHNIPILAYKDDTDEPIFDVKVTLWSTVENSSGIFQREAENLAYPFSDVETLGSETQLRWRNLQSFVSRLTALELIDCSFASPLHYLLPSCSQYPDLEQRRIGGPHRIAGDLMAAAQWLDPDATRKWVFGQCKSVGEGDGSRQIWSMSIWNELKSQMAFISSDGRFEKETRELAKSLGEKMEMEN